LKFLANTKKYTHDDISKIISNLFDAIESEYAIESVLSLLGSDSFSIYLTDEIRILIYEKTQDVLEKNGESFAYENTSIQEALTAKDMEVAQISFIDSIFEKIEVFSFSETELEDFNDNLYSIDYSQILKDNLENVNSTFEYKDSSFNPFKNPISETSTIKEWFTDWRN
jgi:hypothetical protein